MGSRVAWLGIACGATCALAGPPVEAQSAPEPRTVAHGLSSPSPAANLDEARRQDPDRLVALTPDLAIEALAQRIAEFAHELNGQRRVEVLATLLAGGHGDRLLRERRALAPFEGEHLRTELQARLGTRFVDVVGPGPWTNMLELDLAVARLAGAEVQLDALDLRRLSAAGLVLWGDGGGALAAGGGYGPLPPGPGTFADAGAAWLRELPRQPYGIVPRLLRLVLNLDQDDPARAFALLRAWDVWPELAVRNFTPLEPARYGFHVRAIRGPGTDAALATSPDPSPATLLLVGEAATWEALHGIARDLADVRRTAKVAMPDFVPDEFARTVILLERVLQAVRRGQTWLDRSGEDAVGRLWWCSWQLAHTADAHGGALFAPADAQDLVVDGRTATAFPLRASPRR